MKLSRRSVVRALIATLVAANIGAAGVLVRNAVAQGTELEDGRCDPGGCKCMAQDTNGGQCLPFGEGRTCSTHTSCK